MKKIYYFILTLFTITCCNAADSPMGTPTEDDGRSTAGFSDAGSYSAMDSSRPLLRPATYVLPEGVDQFDRDKLVGVLADTAEAYSVLFQYTDGIDTRVQDLSNHVGRMLNLPKDEVQASNLVANSLSKLRDNIAEAFKRLKDAKKSKKLTVEQNKALEARIAELMARVTEFEESEERLKKINGDQMNAFTQLEEITRTKEARIALLNEHMREISAANTELTQKFVAEEAAAQRARNHAADAALVTVTAEPGTVVTRADTADAALATVTAERDAAKAEIRRLEAAAQARQSKPAARGDEGDRLLDSGDSINGGRRSKKDEGGCPCLVM